MRTVWDLFHKEGNNTLYGDNAARGDLMVGDDGNDKLFGRGGDDLLLGGRGHDTLHGGAGDDEIRGGSGNDRIYIDPGDNIYDGGTGRDTMDFSRSVIIVDGGLFGSSHVIQSATGGISVDLETGVTRQQSFGSDAYDIELGTNTFTSIETYELTDGDDIVRGDNTSDTFAMNGGDDLVEGRGGADTIIGDRSVGIAGDNFEDGFDTASYESSPSGVNVDLSRAGAQSGGDAEGDVLIGIEGLIGSHHDDRLAGDQSANNLDGGAGNDEIIGGGGTDTLRGGAGNDVFIFDETSDSTGNFLQRDTIVDFDRASSGLLAGRFEGITGNLDLLGGRYSGTPLDRPLLPSNQGDKIDVSGIDAVQGVPGTGGDQAFTFIGDAAFTTAGQLRVIRATDPEGRAFNLVQGDVDGDGVADFSVSVYTSDDSTLTATDFIL